MNNLKKKIVKLKNKKNNKKGFVILIAIVVSGLLVSLGMFIANVAYKELILSISGKASQQAFFVANSVIECALRHDIRGAGFRLDTTDPRTKAELALHCNNFIFKEEDYNANTAPEVSANSDQATSVYFVSFAKDTDTDGVLDPAEISSQPDAPYAKVIVLKYKIGTVDDKTVIKVFGHNKYSGTGIVERGIKVNY